MAEKDAKKSDGFTLQDLATIVGLLAFFFGVQNFTELRDTIFPSHATPSPSPSPTPVVTPDREAVKWRYIRAADAVCARFAAKAPPGTKAITQKWMTTVLDLRRQNLDAWQAVRWPGSPVDAVYVAEINKILQDFDDATRYWESMTNDFRSGNKVQYNFDHADFVAANGSFVDGANRFGFGSCNYGFPTATAWP